MKECQEPYRLLWGGCSDAIAAMERQQYELARELLIEAQQRAEESYILHGEDAGNNPTN